MGVEAHAHITKTGRKIATLAREATQTPNNNAEAGSMASLANDLAHFNHHLSRISETSRARRIKLNGVHAIVGNADTTVSRNGSRVEMTITHSSDRVQRFSHQQTMYGSITVLQDYLGTPQETRAAYIKVGVPGNQPELVRANRDGSFTRVSMDAASEMIEEPEQIPANSVTAEVYSVLFTELPLTPELEVVTAARELAIHSVNILAKARGQVSEYGGALVNNTQIFHRRILGTAQYQAMGINNPTTIDTVNEVIGAGEETPSYLFARMHSDTRDHIRELIMATGGRTYENIKAALQDERLTLEVLSGLIGHAAYTAAQGENNGLSQAQRITNSINGMFENLLGYTPYLPARPTKYGDELKAIDEEAERQFVLLQKTMPAFITTHQSMGGNSSLYNLHAAYARIDAIKALAFAHAAQLELQAAGELTAFPLRPRQQTEIAGNLRNAFEEGQKSGEADLPIYPPTYGTVL